MSSTRATGAHDSLGKTPGSVWLQARSVVSLTRAVCAEHLDEDYADLCRKLLGRLTRKRPSPLLRGDLRIWAARVLHPVGTINFLFDPSQMPHMTVEQFGSHMGVAKSTMSAKSKTIRDALRLRDYHPDFCRRELMVDHSTPSTCPGRGLPQGPDPQPRPARRGGSVSNGPRPVDRWGRDANGCAGPPGWRQLAAGLHRGLESHRRPTPGGFDTDRYTAYEGLQMLDVQLRPEDARWAVRPPPVPRRPPPMGRDRCSSEREAVLAELRSEPSGHARPGRAWASLHEPDVAFDKALPRRRRLS
jgi:hypothetical protein